MSDMTNYHKHLSTILLKRKSYGENLSALRIGDLLCLAGVLSKEYLKSALKIQGVGKQRLGEILVEQGFATNDQISATLAVKYGFEFVDLDQRDIPPEILSLIPASLAQKIQVVPLEFKDNALVVAIADPADHSDVEDLLRFTLKRRVKIVIAGTKQIEKVLDVSYSKKALDFDEKDKIKLPQRDQAGMQKKASSNIEDIIDKMVDDDHIDVTVAEETDDDFIFESDSLVIKLVNNILISASSKNVSDIHFEPKCIDGKILVRFRIDGICHDVHVIAPIYERAIISRLKILANLDITERRRPQSGKIVFQYLGESIEYRLEITPTAKNHEDAVLRILTKSSQFGLAELGLSDSNLANFKKIIAKPYGLILCVGPTGSGKTTTLHGALNYINTPERKIWTVEDPVEIEQDRLRQVQVNAEIGLTFQSALRSFLRADPDVIMIGEMRDIETTRTAIEASLTGHLVLSTMHTNTAAETISRLVGMGVEPFNFADALLGVISQRLCRKICPQCKEEYRPTEKEFTEIVKSYGEEKYKYDGLPQFPQKMKLVVADKCPSCHNMGYSGRFSIHELLVNSSAIKMAIQKGDKSAEIHRLAISQGMKTMMMDGIIKVMRQVTTFAELCRVAR